MSIEAMKQVSQAEAEARQLRQSAAVEAKQLVKDAEKAGLHHVEQSRAEVQEKNKLAMQAAEERAAAKSQALLAENATLCEKLSSEAAARLDAAVALIVKRIVSV